MDVTWHTYEVGDRVIGPDGCAMTVEALLSYEPDKSPSYQCDGYVYRETMLKPTSDCMRFSMHTNQSQSNTD